MSGKGGGKGQAPAFKRGIARQPTFLAVKTKKPLPAEVCKWAFHLQEADGHWDPTKLADAVQPHSADLGELLRAEDDVFATLFMVLISEMSVGGAIDKFHEATMNDNSEHGEDHRAAAEAWLSMGERSEERVDIEDNVMDMLFEYVRTEVGRRAHVTDQKRQEKATLMRSKSCIADQEEDSKWSHWYSRKPGDIASVNWRTTKQTMFVPSDQGATNGGVIYTEFESGEAVVLKSFGSKTSATYVAERLAQTMAIHVAGVRFVETKAPEFGEIIEALQRVPSHIPGLVATKCEILKSHEFCGVMEFVPGGGLVGKKAKDCLTDPRPTMLKSIGRLCVYDCLLNNKDRFPVFQPDVLDHELASLIVLPGGLVVGIDQRVHPFSDGPDMQKHLRMLNRLGRMCLATDSGKKMTDYFTKRIYTGVRTNCGASLSDESLQFVLQGFKDGLLRVAKLWESGAILRCLVSAEKDLVSKYQQPQATAEASTNFVRRACAEIWAGVRGAPLPSAFGC